jgi:hypothetical protein
MLSRHWINLIAMSTVRPLPAIQADIAAAALRLADLESERARSREARRIAIVADFDGGMTRPDIAAKWGVDYGTVASVLHKARRTERTRRARGLTPEQRRHYDALVRQRIPTLLARTIARTVAPAEQP